MAPLQLDEERRERGQLGACYRQETGQAPAAKESVLLAQYAPELVLQLSAAFQGTVCDPKQPASDACLAQLAALPCEPLAAAIRARGWDRAPSPAMEAAIAKYSDRLVSRYMACRAGPEHDMEEASVRTEHMATRTALQISLQITTGQCNLDEAQLQACLGLIAAPDACAQLLQHAAQSRLPRFCAHFVDCSAEPALVGKIAH